MPVPMVMSVVDVPVVAAYVFVVAVTGPVPWGVWVGMVVTVSVVTGVAMDVSVVMLVAGLFAGSLVVSVCWGVGHVTFRSQRTRVGRWKSPSRRKASAKA